MAKAAWPLFNLADELEPTQALNVIYNMTDDQKRCVKGFLALVMGCDGVASPEEVQLWNFVCNTTKCPEMSYQESLLFWKNN